MSLSKQVTGSNSVADVILHHTTNDDDELMCKLIRPRNLLCIRVLVSQMMSESVTVLTAANKWNFTIFQYCLSLAEESTPITIDSRRENWFFRIFASARKQRPGEAVRRWESGQVSRCVGWGRRCRRRDTTHGRNVTLTGSHVRLFPHSPPRPRPRVQQCTPVRVEQVHLTAEETQVILQSLPADCQLLSVVSSAFSNPDSCRRL